MPTTANANNQGNNRQAKRVRTDPMAANQAGGNTTTNRGNTGKKTSPTQAAKIALETQSESHHPAMASICLPLGKAILELHLKALHKKEVIRKMEEEDDHIPHSLRINVGLQHSEEALEMMTPLEKEHLTNQLKVVNDTYKREGKKVIIESNKMDLKAFHLKVKSLTVELIHNATSTFITAEGIEGTTPADTHNKAYNLMDHHGNHLFKHHKHGKVFVQQFYLDKYELEDNPTVIELPDLTAAYANAEEQEEARQLLKTNSNYPEMRYNLKLKKILEDTLIIPYNQFLLQKEQNARELALKQKLVALMEGQATEATAMELDEEMPTDRQTLKLLLEESALIAAKRATAPLQKEIAQLRRQAAKEKQPNPKANQRGRQGGGASNKKKSGNQQQPNQKKNSNRSRSTNRSSSTGARDAATTKGNSKKKGKSRGPSNRKNTSSGTRGNK
jgi:hypothetical protein